MKQKVDSAADEATRRARAEADRLIAEATRQADTIRAGSPHARGQDSPRRLCSDRFTRGARAPIPSRRSPRKRRATRLRSETDQQADRVIREADARADALVAAGETEGGRALGGASLANLGATYAASYYTIAGHRLQPPHQIFLCAAALRRARTGPGQSARGCSQSADRCRCSQPTNAADRGLGPSSRCAAPDRVARQRLHRSRVVGRGFSASRIWSSVTLDIGDLPRRRWCSLSGFERPQSATGVRTSRHHFRRV